MIRQGSIAHFPCHWRLLLRHFYTAKEAFVRSHLSLTLSLVLLIVVGYRAVLAAPRLLTMTCVAPQGTELSYGRGLLGIEDLIVDTRPTASPGTQLTFVIEAEQPQWMRVTWAPPPAEERGPATTFDATVIATTDDQITAVQPHGEGVWMYSIFPRLGMSYVSAHNHIPFGTTSRSLALYALCHSTREAP
jgi:hypothetical protein